MSLPSALFCRSSKMFQFPERTSSWVLGWGEGARLLSAEAAGDREKCRRGGMQFAPRAPPNRSSDIHAWRSPQPRPQRTERPAAGWGKCSQSFPRVQCVGGRTERKP